MAEISHDPVARRFSVEVEGQRAILDYAVSGDVMTISHTGVPGALEGRGIAAELMRAALRTAETAHWKVNPVCSYAAAYLAKHPQATEKRPPEKRHEDELLDEALEESFPASDPPAVGGSS